MCKSLKLSGAEEGCWIFFFFFFFFFFCNKLKSDLNIFYRHFATAHSASPKSQTECALFSKPVHTYEKKKKKRIVGDIFTSCVFLWCCFLKNNINHSDFLSRRKSACEWLPFGFPCLKKEKKKKNPPRTKKKKKKKCNPATKTQYFCWPHWVVSESKGGVFPFTPSHPHAHTSTNRHTRS